MDAILKTVELTKTFGGVTAVSDINLNIYKNEIQGIIGPNGAGKTTLFNLISGIYEPTSGDVFLENSAITGKKSHEVNTMGVARTFQNIRLFNNMTVLDNVLVGCHQYENYSSFASLFKTKNYKNEEARNIEFANELLKSVNLYRYRHEKPSSLSYGFQRRLEIARALASKPKVLMLDEPAAGMNEIETASLTKYIRNLKSPDLAIILIEHDMKLVMDLSDKIFVMNYGKEIARGKPEEIVKNKQVIDAYLGEADI